MRTAILATAALFIGLSTSVSAQQTALDKFLAKHQDAVLSSNIDLSANGSNVLGAIIKTNSDAKSKEAMKKIKKARLYVFNGEKAPDSAEWRALSRDLHQDKFEDLMTVKQGGDGVSIMMTELKGGLREVVCIVHGDGVFLLDLTGNFTDGDLSQLKVSMNDNGSKKDNGAN